MENNVRVLLDTSIPVLPKVNSNHFDVVFHIGEDVGFGSPTNAKPQARRTMDLKGKTAIISGGGRDLGRAFRLDILRHYTLDNRWAFGMTAYLLFLHSICKWTFSLSASY